MLSRKVIWAEMARRKMQFHSGESWETINLWGLFDWDEVSRLLKTGELITDMKCENRTIWVRPSPEAYHKNIEPLLSKTLEEVSKLAG